MPDYPLIADRVKDMRVKRDVLIDGGGAFLETRRAKGDSGLPKKRWELLHDHITLSEWTALLDFFNARAGAWETFTFTDPANSLPYTVRFASDTLRAEKPFGRESNQLFIVNVALKEVR